MKKKITKKIGEELWEFVKNIGGLIEDIAFTPYGQLRIGQMPGDTYYDRLNRFVEKGVVRKQKRAGIVRYKLTSKGQKLLNQQANLRRRKDGLMTVVIFDIPIEKNKERTAFRRYLLRNGFRWLQKSVLVSANYLPEEVKYVASELSLKEYVTIISGEITPMTE